MAKGKILQSWTQTFLHRIEESKSAVEQALLCHD